MRCPGSADELIGAHVNLTRSLGLPGENEFAPVTLLFIRRVSEVALVGSRPYEGSASTALDRGDPSRSETWRSELR